MPEDYLTISHNFCQELKAAQKGDKSSLSFIVHKLSPQALVKDKELFQVLKIGGSISQNALVYSDKGQIKIESLEEEHLPIFSTGKAFLSFVKANLRKQVKFLALNFAYPMKPVFENNRLDGILLKGSKEHEFNGLVGKQIGLTIETHIRKKFRRKIVVSTANDTICLLLSGLIKEKAITLAGGVVGTGINFAFFPKADSAVNLESACFDKFELSQTGKIIDEKSIAKHDALFEKEVSGAYLHQHYNLLRDKQFKRVVSTHGLDKVCRGEISGDKVLARRLFQRSARLVAAQVAGIVKFKKQPMTFVMEGSLFWLGYNFQKTVKDTVKQLVPEYQVQFISIEDCGIVGAAKLLV